jgi:hypothetical protein
MYIEHFDKCSDLKTIIYKSSDPNSLTDKCAELEEIYNDYEKHGHLYYGNDEAVTKNEPLDLSIFNLSNIFNINLLNNLNIENVNTSGLILIFILIMLVTNIYIAIPLVPFMVVGSVMVSVFAIMLAIILLFLIYYLFS